MSSNVNLTDQLRSEYRQLFHDCKIKEDKRATVSQWAEKIAKNRDRYLKISERTGGVPWFIIGLIHYRECGMSFSRHLHNGDPLKARTVNVPSGRPPIGQPPFKFDDSAVDALRVDKLDKVKNWELERTLYMLESFNGFGYRLYHPSVLSPYVWGFTEYYERGGYPKDGVWSENYVSQQCGSGTLLLQMILSRAVLLNLHGNPISNPTENPWKVFDTLKYAPGEMVEAAKAFQAAANTFPGIKLTVDGYAGKLTAIAYLRITGKSLPGAPTA